VPVKEIQDKGYDLSINKYKEIEREKVEYEASEVIMGRIEMLESEIQQAISDLRQML
jgi:type I restriction enzyme M protein